MSATTVGVYRMLLRLYPHRFRDEYGPDMALLFACQLRDEPTGRVLVRTVLDLAITIPTRHLEAHMNRPPNSLVPILFTALGTAGLGIALVGGTNPGMLGVGLSIAVAFLGLAAAAWRRGRPVAEARAVTAHWRRYLAGGAAILVAVTVTTTVTGEVDEALWLPLMVTIATAFALVGTGLALGVAHRHAGHPRNTPT